MSVQVAQYGKSAPSKAVCPQHSSTPGQQDLPPNVTCLWPNALQVSTIMLSKCQVNSCFTLKTLSEDQRTTVINVFFWEQQKIIPEVSYRTLKARGKNISARHL
jgi:hypothetical protein